MSLFKISERFTENNCFIVISTAVWRFNYVWLPLWINDLLVTYFDVSYVIFLSFHFENEKSAVCWASEGCCVCCSLERHRLPDSHLVSLRHQWIVLSDNYSLGKLPRKLAHRTFLQWFEWLGYVHIFIRLTECNADCKVYSPGLYSGPETNIFSY